MKITQLAKIGLVGLAFFGLYFYLSQDVGPQKSSAAATDSALRDAARISDVQVLQNAIDLYYKKCGYYPGPANPGPRCGPFVAINTRGELVKVLLGSNLGLSRIPTDPKTVDTYLYSTNAAGTSY